MGDLNQYVGREVKGVKFKNDKVGYYRRMDKYIGASGVIVKYIPNTNSFKVDFDYPKKDCWHYPVVELLPQLELEIIGYNVNDEKYSKIIAKLVELTVDMLLTPDKNGCHFAKGSFIYDAVVEYDLLDKCTPVFKETKISLPNIKGFEGVDEGDEIKYGCARLSKSWFEKTENRHILTLELNSGVRIEFEEMEAIRKYLDSKK